MPTELQSRFDSAEIGSARFFHSRPGHARQVCRSTAFTLLRLVQQLFVQVTSDTGPLPASGTRVSAENIRVIESSVGGDGWNEATLRAVYALASYAHAPGSFLAAISQDLMLRGTLSVRTMQTVVWLPYAVTEDRGVSDPHFGAGAHLGAGSPNDIVFPAGAVMPRFGTTPPVPPSGLDSAPECHVEGQGVAAGPPVQAESALRLTVPLLLGAAATAIFVATVTTDGAPTRKDLRDAAKARANPSGKQIVLAWFTTRLMGLAGVTKPRAVAAMWLLNGGSKEIAAAKAYGNKELTKAGDSFPRVFVYEQSEQQPLQRARRELAASRKNPAITVSSPLVQLQQAVMEELHRSGVWGKGMRTRDVGGSLKLAGDTSTRGNRIGNVWRDTRIPRIARLLGYGVRDTDNGWSLTFDPIGDHYSDWLTADAVRDAQRSGAL